MTNYKCRCFRCSNIFSPNDFHISREARTFSRSNEEGKFSEFETTKSETYACPKCLCDGFDYVFNVHFVEIIIQLMNLSAMLHALNVLKRK